MSTQKTLAFSKAALDSLPIAPSGRATYGDTETPTLIVRISSTWERGTRAELGVRL